MASSIAPFSCLEPFTSTGCYALDLGGAWFSPLPSQSPTARCRLSMSTRCRAPVASLPATSRGHDLGGHTARQYTPLRAARRVRPRHRYSLRPDARREETARDDERGCTDLGRQ